MNWKHKPQTQITYQSLISPSWLELWSHLQTHLVPLLPPFSTLQVQELSLWSSVNSVLLQLRAFVLIFFFFFLGCTFPDLCGSLSSFSLNAASLEKTYLIILVKFVPLAIPPFYSAQFYSFISRITIEMNCISVCVYYLSLLLDFNLHELETLSSCSLQLLQSYMWHILSMKTVCEMDPDWTENVIYSSFLTYLSAFPVTWWPQYLTQT